MFKALVLAPAAIVASASSIKDYPSSDMFHSHCELTTTVAAPCRSVYTTFNSPIAAYAKGDQGSGLYSVHASYSGDFCAIRETPTHHYKDDILFSLVDSNGACTVTAKSRSQSLSVYDFDTNYCNMYNILKSETLSNLTISKCAYSPSSDADREVQCAKY